MWNVKGEGAMSVLNPKTVLKLGFLHIPELGSWFLESGTKGYDMVILY